MKKLYVYRGLPGSGKTTRARELQAKIGARLVGRDHLRPLLGINGAVGRSEQEVAVTKEQERLIRDGLRAGQPVIVDDMNLRARYVRRFAEIAHDEGASLVVIDLTDLPVDDCVARDFNRGYYLDDRYVGEPVIRDLHKRFIKGQPYPLPVPDVADKPADPTGLYVPDPELPRAWIVDIDGTVATLNGRSPYDYGRVLEDLPNAPVVQAVRAQVYAGDLIVFVSGRPDSCEVETRHWLSRHVTTRFDDLLMRQTGDGRRDDVVKREIFDGHIRGRYNVVGVFDDRQRVVDMWRSLGLTVFQVAPHHF